MAGAVPFPKLPVLARLVPVTSEARTAAGGRDLAIRHFPFKVGVERRRDSQPFDGPERRTGVMVEINDVYLAEYASYQRRELSHEHFQIEGDGAGVFELVDRGSRRGALVNGRRVGGDHNGGRGALHDGDVITVGTPASPFVFKFVVEPVS